MWALDLGTTNSLLARWDPSAEQPAILEMPELCRRPVGTDALEAPRVVPSATEMLPPAARLRRLFFVTPQAVIGRPAMERNQIRPRSAYVPTFKRALSQTPAAPVARVGGVSFNAREVATAYVRELLARGRAVAREPIRELVVTTPVDAFETYRAELTAMAKRLRLRRIRFLDEPVAAALGYGLGPSRERCVLVVDFGGGTLHMAVVSLGVAQARAGKGDVLAKASRDVGGNLVDQWVLAEFCRRLDYGFSGEPDDEQRLWRAWMLAEACRVKEALHFGPARFEVSPPESLRRFEARLRGESAAAEMTRQELVQLLTERGLYQALEGCLDQVLQQAAARGVSASGIDDVLMVGGSSLLPEVFALFEGRFGRGRVRAWQPFEAVAYGATLFAAGRVEPADFIVHDYALLTFEAKTGKPQHAVIVPGGTRFPTAADFWKRQLVPTCSLGEPERVFKLVICEISHRGPGRTFSWDEGGGLHKVEDGAAPVVVKLNASNPALGYLDPPHHPADARPRLEVSFGVNADRWLCATVSDLLTRKRLMSAEPVVRLL
jgi:molecular chaperone DnaK (HSP70)